MGNTSTIKMVLGRVWPVRRGFRLAIDLPPLKTSNDINEGLFHIIYKMAQEEISIEEALDIAKVIECKRKFIETNDIQNQIQELMQKVDLTKKT